MAYSALGDVYRNMDQTARAGENMRKAYELRQRVSERERLSIDSGYEAEITGDLEAARKIYEMWAQTYPHDAFPRGGLGVISCNLGEYSKAVAAFHEALKLDPGDAVAYADLVAAYTGRDQPR